MIKIVQCRAIRNQAPVQSTKAPRIKCLYIKVSCAKSHSSASAPTPSPSFATLADGLVEDPGADDDAGPRGSKKEATTQVAPATRALTRSLEPSTSRTPRSTG